jgi:hypothetical protein
VSSVIEVYIAINTIVESPTDIFVSVQMRCILGGEVGEGQMTKYICRRRKNKSLGVLIIGFF